MAVTASIRSSSVDVVRASLTGGKHDVKGIVFALLLLACMLTSLLMLTVLLWDVVADHDSGVREAQHRLPAERPHVQS